MIYQGISVFTNKPIDVKVQGKFIQEVTPSKTKGHLPYISPGFLDIQVNGYMGNDYSLEDFSVDQLLKIISHLNRSGTTQHVPTIITSPRERILMNLKTISRAIRCSEDIAHAIAGIHLEGPFISPKDGPRGAHNAAHVRPPDLSEFQQWQEAAEGRITIVTLSPEWDGAIQFIKAISAAGVTAAIGHTAASPGQIKAAVEAGARLSTHLGNASHPMIPRLKNYIWEQLAEDRLMAGMICDGFHLPKSVVQVFTRTKGLERLILVSDAAYLGGLKPGLYKWNDVDVQVFDDGHLGLPGTEALAGAAHLLDWDIPRFMEFTGYSLKETIPLCTQNPARLLRMSDHYGRLEPGAPANLVLFDYEPGMDRLRIMKTIRCGKEVNVLE
ncbi:MAG: amidohydrolase family protein [Deltaproteobacteria bacterium]|nr:amidohydrolase family protein [Deltaproteobacteria bacterium]